MKWTLNRSGIFGCELIGANSCGPDTPVAGMKYTVEVTAYGLDARGFVVQHGDIDDLFQGVTKTALSCELLAQQMAYRVVKLCRDEIQDFSALERCHVTIHGCSNSHVKYEWLQGDALRIGADPVIVTDKGEMAAHRAMLAMKALEILRKVNSGDNYNQARVQGQAPSGYPSFMDGLSVDELMSRFKREYPDREKSERSGHAFDAQAFWDSRR